MRAVLRLLFDRSLSGKYPQSRHGGSRGGQMFRFWRLRTLSGLTLWRRNGDAPSLLMESSYSQHGNIKHAGNTWAGRRMGRWQVAGGDSAGKKEAEERSATAAGDPILLIEARAAVAHEAEPGVR